ncbi:unnamed protein product, partial [Rotaria sp. Silwood1]
TFSDIYPNCDIVSAGHVKIFGEYLGFNATCTAGNQCFMINSTLFTSTTSQTGSAHFANMTLGAKSVNA